MGRKKRKKQRITEPVYTIHHIVPTSRGGQEHNNKVVLPNIFHSRWHSLFGNMTNEEVFEFIKRVMVPDKIWSKKELEKIRKEIKGEPWTVQSARKP